MVTAGRTAQIVLRVSPEEKAMAETMAQEDGLSTSDVIRQSLRRAYRERFGEKKPKVRK